MIMPRLPELADLQNQAKVLAATPELGNPDQPTTEA
jgi:hypothetical protein